MHPDGYSTTAVRDIVRRQGLDYLSDDHVDGLRKELRKHLPHPFHPLDKRHRRSQSFLSKEQVFGFFHPDKPSVIAHRLLERSRAKETIESMSLVNEPVAFISHRVKMLGLKCTPEAVERYQHFYWDLNLVDSTEIRALLRMRVEWMQIPRDPGMMLAPDQWLQYESLHKAAYKDPRRTLVEMPITPVAGMLGQMRLGLMPAQVDLGRLAEAARNAAAGRVLESMLTAGPQDAARGRDFAMVSQLMTDLIEKVGSPDTALQEELKKVALQTEDGPVPHIAELPAGDTFTTEMTPADREKKDAIDTK